MLSKYKDSLLASVSHDLRTPLSAMLLFIDIAYNSDDVQEIRSHLVKGKKTGDLVRAMVDDLLDYS